MKERSNMSAFVKEHKWVNNHGQPPSKRRRINAACLTCRKRKTRCAGEKPACSTCVKNGHRCLGYNEIETIKTEERDGSVAPKSGFGGFVSLKNEPVDDYGNGSLRQPGVKEERHERHIWHTVEYAHENDKAEYHYKHAKQQPVAGFVDAGSLSRHDAFPGPTTTSGSSRRRKHSNDSDDDDDNDDHSPGSTTGVRSNGTKDSRTEDGKSTNNHSPAPPRLHDDHETHRVPYFRYFGPTAIVPGHKQMLVNRPPKERERRKSRGDSFSTASTASPVLGAATEFPQGPQPLRIQLDGELHTFAEVHPYELDDGVPPHELIVILVTAFFKNLGSNFRFLKEKRTMRLLREKRLEPILVDAMCALAARYLEHPVFENEHDGAKKRSEYGHVFAQRAKAATVDTFPCPSVAAVQACLLMAYEGFGADQDSSLWMYLGLAIRMALDLGLQKVEGVRFKGEADPWYTRNWGCNDRDESEDRCEKEDDLAEKERAAVEQERIDTFWAVFILDRVISSGTGRPVTFRDGDFDLSFPPRRRLPGPLNLLDPFPAFLEVIHLYGRVSDILNNIKCGSELNEDLMGRLRVIEQDLNVIYHEQHELLHFNPVSFQQYSALGIGTTFILLHFWFHALVIIIHQPTMLNEKWNLNPVQLNEKSREVCMSSAKSITDILIVSAVMSAPCFVGNPFTSQPIYIAACAFLLESGALKSESQPSSRLPSPHLGSDQRLLALLPGSMSDMKGTQHALLVSVATQNYRHCYESLKRLHTYWGGVGYIITALNQKSKGTWDCETFTAEEYAAIKRARRAGPLSRLPRLEHPASPNIIPIGYSLTGTTNSPNSNLTVLFPNPVHAPVQPVQAHNLPPAPSSVPTSAATPPGNMIYDPIRQSHVDTSSVMFPPAYPQPKVSAVRHQPHASKLSSSFRSTATGKSVFKYGSPSAGDTDQHHGVSHSPSPLNHQSYASETSSEDTPTSGLPVDSSEGGSSGSSGSSNEHSNHNHGHGDQTQGGNAEYIYNEFEHDFSLHPGFINGQYSFLGLNSSVLSDTIAINTQEVNFDAVGFHTEMMPAWLEILPENMMGGLFDGGVLGMSGQHYHI